MTKKNCLISFVATSLLAVSGLSYASADDFPFYYGDSTDPLSNLISEYNSYDEGGGDGGQTGYYEAESDFDSFFNGYKSDIPVSPEY